MTGRTLVLLRHAKAEPPNGVPDAERPLAARGRDDAVAVGAWLARRRLRPDVVLSSPAVRTRQTWQRVAVGMAGDSGDEAAQPDAAQPEVRYEPQLYYGGAEEMLELVRGLSDTVTIALVVAHNPTVSHVSLLLTPDDSVGGLSGLRTSGLAVHRVTGPWSGCGPGAADLVERHTARA